MNFYSGSTVEAVLENAAQLLVRFQFEVRILSHSPSLSIVLSFVLLVLQQPNVLSILIGHTSLLQFLGKGRITLGTLLETFLLQLDARIDLIQTLLYLLGYGRWCGYMISGSTETILIGGVLYIDYGTLG